MLCVGCRPSEIMDIDDPYTAFCFDEACSYIIQRINEGDDPIIKEPKKETVTKTKHLRPSEIFSKYSNSNIHV